METGFVTGEVRFSYVNLVTPRVPTNGGEPKYSATLLIPKSDTVTKAKLDAAINAAIQKGVSEKWGGQMPARPHVPVYDGDGVRDNGESFGPECKGHWVLTASSKQQPGVVDRNVQRVIDTTKIYSGMYGYAQLNCFAYLNAGKRGVGIGLQNVQIIRDGEQLAGNRQAPEDVFNAVGGAPQYGAPAQQPYAPAQYGSAQPSYSYSSSDEI